MEKILLIAVNSSWSQSNPALYYMRQVLRPLPYSTEILAFTTGEPVLQTATEIYRKRGAILCFSAYIWNKTYLISLLKVLRQLLPSVKMVIGGPEADSFAGLQDAFIIRGAGEGALWALAESGFESLAKHPPQIPLKDLPFPYVPEDLPALQDHLIYYECYRGCPYHCVYCLSARDERKEPRFDLPQDEAKLKCELDALMMLKPRTLKFIDRSFNINPRLAHYIWSYAMQDSSLADFHFEIYPDLISEEDLKILAAAPPGKIRFEIGIQSTNSEITAAVGRHSDFEKSRKVLMNLQEMGNIRVHADLLAGLPGENMESVLKSLDELCACEPAAVQLGMLKILPDTPMREIAKNNGYIWMQEPPYQVLVSDALSFEELSRLDDFAHLLSLYWNKEEFKEEWHALLQKKPASVILEELLKIHEKEGYPLHSVGKGKRMEVMSFLVQSSRFKV